MLSKNAIKNYIIKQFNNFLIYIVDKYGLELTYNVMPNDYTLKDMKVGTVFKTRGYYEANDGYGGRYLIDSSRGRKLSSAPNKFILCLDNYGQFDNEIDVCKYGVRPSNKIITEGDSMVESDYYADTNSEIINNLTVGKNRTTLVFPAGKFYFSKLMNLSSKQMNIKGAKLNYISSPQNAIKNNSYVCGTQLIFPFLKNRTSAISTEYSTIENVSIIGSPLNYSISFDKTKVGTGEKIVSESNKISCMGIIGKDVVLKNVNVSHFAWGINLQHSTISSYINNVFITQCGVGAMIGNNTKIMGLYGDEVSTLVESAGSNISINQLKCGACVNIIHLFNGKNIVFSDIDGDYCVGAMILIGYTIPDVYRQDPKFGYKSKEDNLWHAYDADVKNLNILSIHGKAMIEKSYDKTAKPNGIDISSTRNTQGYGLIEILDNATFKDSYILLNGNIGEQIPVDDADSSLRTPNVALVFNKNNSVCQNNYFVISEALDSDGIKKVFQLKENNDNRIDTSIGTFYTKDLLNTTNTTTE